MGLTLALLIAACAPAAPAAPTAAPAPTAPPKAAPTAAPAQPGAKPTEAPAAKPAEKPSEQPEAKPAASPKPAAQPAVKFDQKAIEEFYRGRTVRISVGFAPGGTSDSLARLAARYLPRFLPGSPTVVVENKPGAGSILAANLLYNTEPKDGTVIGAISEGLVLQQAVGTQGIEFDAAKFNWLASSGDDAYACMVHKETGVNSIQQVIDGKEVIIGTLGPGSPLHATAAIVKTVLGANFRLVPGYDTAAKIILALESREVDGVCLLVEGQFARQLLERDKPVVSALVVMGDKTPDLPYVKGVPAAETLAKTDEAKLLLRAVHAQSRITFPLALPPGAPQDRVAALRKAMNDVAAHPEFQAEVAKTGFVLKPKSGEQVRQIIQDLLATPAPVIAKLKQIIN